LVVRRLFAVQKLKILQSLFESYRLNIFEYLEAISRCQRCHDSEASSGFIARSICSDLAGLGGPSQRSQDDRQTCFG
jgi:hypothetical protein